MTDDSFATCLSNWVGLYSRIRHATGHPMSATEIANACLAVIALVAEQFEKADQARLFEHCHGALDELAEACEQPGERTLQ